MTTLRVPQIRYESAFATVVQSVPDTRRKAKAVLAGCDPAMDRDDENRALLIISELVGNTVKHAARTSPQAEIALDIGDGCLTIAVHDRDPGLPRALPTPHPDGSGGWGMRMVHDLAAEVEGTVEVRSDPDRQGKAVQVSLPL